jgi:hypothetical protein
MVSRVISIYNGNLEKLMTDLIIYEKIIQGWNEKHPEYDISLTVEIDAGEFYTLSIQCKKA